MALRVLFASAEAHPLAKTSGVGDVAGSLPRALRELGVDVRVVLPRYGSIARWTEDLGTFPVVVGGGVTDARLLRAELGPVPVYLIDHPPLFDRPKMYDHEDDGQRFGFFCRAVLDLLPKAGFWPDVLHANDWHTALAPAFLRTSFAHNPRYARIRSVLTVHNLREQGAFGRELFDWLGLPPDARGPAGVEWDGRVNFLKAGIVYADRVNTVSPTYAREVQAEEHGARLDGILRSRASGLSGILNGIDTDVWNPAKDEHIAQPYSRSSVERKAANKAALQEEVRFPREPSAPLMGVVARITDQKGFDILIPALPQLVKAGAQVVLLGTGDRMYEDPIALIAKAHREFAAFLRYDEALAHRIYAASDFFLMPSRFEPCGLGQLIALRYGAVPIVRATGGLVDTITDIGKDPKRGNGFVFSEYTPKALLDTAARAIEFYHRGRGWKALQARGMAQDLSWRASAREYLRLYERTLAQGAQGTTAA